MKIYIAGPLFCKAELDYNEQLAKFLSDHGFATFLPQRDGYQQTELEKTVGKTKSSEMIFEKDVQELKSSDVVVFNMDGRVPDEGACVEIGYAYALGKKCVGVKTDSRSLISGLDNPLIIGALNNRIAKNFDELSEFL